MEKTMHTRRRRWPAILALILAALLLGTIGLGWVRRRNSAAQNIQPVTAQAVRGSIRLTAYGSGVIEPGRNVPVYAPVKALVEKVYVEKGDPVKQGDVIADLSSPDLTDKIDKLDDSLATLDLKISQARVTAGSTTITAPAAGRLLLVHAAAGQPVDAVMDQYDALAVISTDGFLVVEWSGNSTLQPGDPVQVSCGGVICAGRLIRQNNGLNRVELPDDRFLPGSTALILDQSGRQIGQGVLQISKPVYVTAAGGIIKSVSKQAGAKVSKGSKLFTLETAGLAADYAQLIDERSRTMADLQAARSQLSLLQVIAPADGIVSQINLTEKGQVQENQQLCMLADISSLKMLLQIDELDITAIQTGQTASLKLAAAEYQAYSATVSRISAIGTSAAGVTTYPVTLAIEPAPGILAGMSASADILVADRQNVLIIPLEALKVDGSRTYVTLVQRSANGQMSTSDRDVTVGLANGTAAEIVSGLSEGDEVVTTGTTAKTSGSGPLGLGGLRQNRNGG